MLAHRIAATFTTGTTMLGLALALVLALISGLVAPEPSRADPNRPHRPRRSGTQASIKGAAASTAMTHVAIAEALDGKLVDWMEKVSDEQYRHVP